MGNGILMGEGSLGAASGKISRGGVLPLESDELARRDDHRVRLGERSRELRRGSCRREGGE